MSDGLKAKISKRLVDATQPPKAGDLRIWDADLKGFMLRVSSAGRKSYCVKYRVNGAQRWVTIGEHGMGWTPDEARNRAREIITEATKGHDLSHSSAARAINATEGGGIVLASAVTNATIGELFTVYFRDGPADKPLKRASSWGVDAISYTRHIKPLLDNAIARELKPSDLSAWQAAVAAGRTSADIKTRKQGRAIVTGGSSAAARAMRCLSAMFSWAIWREFLETNPATKVQKLRDQRRERPITSEEALRLWTVLEEAEAAWVVSSGHADMIRLIILTGARRNEISELRWSEVDFDRSRLLLPPVRTKMGALNRARPIALSDEARAILERNTRIGEFVFPGRVDGKAMVGVNKAWLKVRALAGLEDVRLHDLRHSFATFAVEDGASLYLVGKALGHTSAASTERYTHPGEAAARVIADKVAKRILAAGRA
jgi:integrase